MQHHWPRPILQRPVHSFCNPIDLRRPRWRFFVPDPLLSQSCRRGNAAKRPYVTCYKLPKIFPAFVFNQSLPLFEPRIYIGFHRFSHACLFPWSCVLSLLLPSMWACVLSRFGLSTLKSMSISHTSWAHYVSCIELHEIIQTVSLWFLSSSMIVFIAEPVATTESRKKIVTWWTIPHKSNFTSYENNTSCTVLKFVSFITCYNNTITL